MDKKRILLIIGFLLVSFGIGYILYRVFFARPTLPPVEPGVPGVVAPTPGVEFPAAGEGVPGRVEPPGVEVLPPSVEVGTGQSFIPSQPVGRETQLVDSVITSPDFTASGQVQFYNRSDGKFYRVEDGQAQILSDEVFFNVENVTWSPNDNESIIEYPDGSNIYYNFATKRQVTLPKHWEDFSFSSDGFQIASKSVGLSPENRWLIASDPDGNNVKFLEHLGENQDKVTVDWSPNKQIVALSRTGESLGGDRQQILPIGTQGENFKGLIVEGRGLQTEWSKSGKQLLYSVYNANNDFKPQLWIVDAVPGSIGNNRRPLELNTWADKCNFSDDRYIYCGVPTRLEVGSGFQPILADQTPDILYRIDTQTGAKTALPLDETHTIDQIFVSDDGKNISFTDKNRTGIFQVNL